MEWVGGKAKSIDAEHTAGLLYTYHIQGRLVYAVSVLYTEDTSSTLTLRLYTLFLPKLLSADTHTDLNSERLESP
jgi:hypothetical protein